MFTCVAVPTGEERRRPDRDASSSHVSRQRRALRGVTVIATEGAAGAREDTASPSGSPAAWGPAATGIHAAKGPCLPVGLASLTGNGNLRPRLAYRLRGAHCGGHSGPQTSLPVHLSCGLRPGRQGAVWTHRGPQDVAAEVWPTEQLVRRLPGSRSYSRGSAPGPGGHGVGGWDGSRGACAQNE